MTELRKARNFNWYKVINHLISGDINSEEAYRWWKQLFPARSVHKSFIIQSDKWRLHLSSYNSIEHQILGSVTSSALQSNLWLSAFLWKCQRLCECVCVCVCVCVYVCVWNGWVCVCVCVSAAVFLFVFVLSLTERPWEREESGLVWWVAW